MEKPTIASEIVTLVKGITPYFIAIIFAITTMFCLFDGIELPKWFIAIVTATVSGGVTGAVVSRKVSK